MNKKYRLFGKIPVVDILIVVLLVGFFGGAVWLLTREEVQKETGAQAQAKTYPYEAVLLVENVSAQRKGLVTAGDQLYFKGGTFAGEVIEVIEPPFVAYGTNTAGEQVATQMEDRINIYITVKGEATAASDKGIFIGKRRLALDGSLSVGTEKYFWETKVVDLTTEVEK